MFTFSSRHSMHDAIVLPFLVEKEMTRKCSSSFLLLPLAKGEEKEKISNRGKKGQAGSGKERRDAGSRCVMTAPAHVPRVLSAGGVQPMTSGVWDHLFGYCRCRYLSLNA